VRAACTFYGLLAFVVAQRSQGRRRQSRSRVVVLNYSFCPRARETRAILTPQPA